MTSCRRLTVTALVAGAALACALPALAAWQANGSGSAAAKAAFLPAGGTVTATQVALTGSLSWPTLQVGGADVAGYDVFRYDARTPTTQSAAGGACAGTVALPACTDSGAPHATYRYTVRARQHLWTGAESATKSGEINVGSPVPTSVSTTGNGDGNIDSGEKLTVSFNQRLDISTMCSGWVSDTSDHSFTGNSGRFAFNDNAGLVTGNDTVTVTATDTCPTRRFGTFDLGSAGYVSGAVTCGGSSSANRVSGSWDVDTFTLTLTFGAGCSTSAVASSVLTYHPQSGLQNTTPTGVVATVATGNVVQF